MDACVGLGVQVGKFQMSELVGKNNVEKCGKLLVLKIYLVSCKRNVAKNCPFGV